MNVSAIEHFPMRLQQKSLVLFLPNSLFCGYCYIFSFLKGSGGGSVIRIRSVGRTLHPRELVPIQRKLNTAKYICLMANRTEKISLDLLENFANYMKKNFTYEV